MLAQSFLGSTFFYQIKLGWTAAISLKSDTTLKCGVNIRQLEMQSSCETIVLHRPMQPEPKWNQNIKNK